ncbi:Alpha/Beta hydrolase protein [Penicillium chermesinum]|uniref:feruloyl esterase n=1 Tax=Penicillium chermesinum TaxID=63820 RepID=A0A9W9TNM8_9EURO|nr:Alpha/Beta hydrolase protein [Penicillium chermesinum]KAJ5232912.1 Alpha/Beta hydrolase protein [Penicillium chermesinum]KAJ6172563.1 Alpha/Beta hydrolase protein [Penicillium chermesinum]
MAQRLTRILVLGIWLLLNAQGSVAESYLKTIKSSNRDRSYWIHTPDANDQSKQYPLVVAFHGSSQIGLDADGLAMELDIRLSLPVIPTEYSKNRFFVYPNGVKGAWAGPSYANVSVREDLQFVKDLVADVQANNNIDTSRIYATGLSNGGGFVGTIACSDVGGLFAAFAPVAGAFYTDTDFSDHSSCTPARSPLPILEIHGGSDKTVYYEGGHGEGGMLPAIPDWLAAWQRRNGCGANTTVNSDNGNVHHTTWSCQDAGNALQHWKVDKNGHDWPSRTINADMIVAGMGPQPIEANDLVIDFFDQFSLP